MVPDGLGMRSRRTRAINKEPTMSNPLPEWVTRGKTIRQLIQELSTFENQDLEVRMSLDYGDTHHAISIVERHGPLCLLVNAEAYYRGPWQKIQLEAEEG
jgi:hypothetical protein